MTIFSGRMSDNAAMVASSQPMRGGSTMRKSASIERCSSSFATVSARAPMNSKLLKGAALPLACVIADADSSTPITRRTLSAKRHTNVPTPQYKSMSVSSPTGSSISAIVRAMMGIMCELTWKNEDAATWKSMAFIDST